MSTVNPELLNFVQQMRANYRSLIPTAGPPDAVFSIKHFDIPAQAQDRAIALRLYTPRERPSGSQYPLVLFVHGGGWVSGDLDTHDVLVRALSLRLNAVVLSVAYGLAPEHKALEQISDVNCALAWLGEHAGELEGDVNKIIAIGDSAGGAIIANLAHLIRNDSLTFAAQWLMYPAVSLEVDTPSFDQYGDSHFPTKAVMKAVTQCFLPEHASPTDPGIIPIHAAHHEIAPTLISIGGADPLASGCEVYIGDLTKAAIKSELKFYPGAEHGFIQFFKNKDEHPLGEQALDEGVATLKAWLGIE